VKDKATTKIIFSHNDVRWLSNETIRAKTASPKHLVMERVTSNYCK
jgi:7-keto-8-aminopelargonate synthetase-like enzyme